MGWSKRWQDMYLVESEEAYMRSREASIRHIYSEIIVQVLWFRPPTFSMAEL